MLSFTDICERAAHPQLSPAGVNTLKFTYLMSFVLKWRGKISDLLTALLISTAKCSCFCAIGVKKIAGSMIITPWNTGFCLTIICLRVWEWVWLCLDGWMFVCCEYLPPIYSVCPPGKVSCAICNKRCRGTVLKIEDYYLHKLCFKCQSKLSPLPFPTFIVSGEK